MTLRSGELCAVASAPWNDKCFDGDGNEKQEKGGEKGQWMAHGQRSICQDDNVQWERERERSWPWPWSWSCAQ